MSHERRRDHAIGASGERRGTNLGLADSQYRLDYIALIAPIARTG